MLLQQICPRRRYPSTLLSLLQCNLYYRILMLSCQTHCHQWFHHSGHRDLHSLKDYKHLNVRHNSQNLFNKSIHLNLHEAKFAADDIFVLILIFDTSIFYEKLYKKLFKSVAFSWLCSFKINIHVSEGQLSKLKASGPPFPAQKNLFPRCMNHIRRRSIC